MRVTLDPRLAAAASLIRRGAAVCDVGTDHGYLAAFLLQEKITDRVTACDINEKPLAAAAATAQKYQTEQGLTLRLSDGLCGVPAEEAEDIAICGMGGELIAQILEKCSYAKDGGRRFILQPMTQIPYLRSRLYSEGFAILREVPAADKNHRYTVLHVKYTGECMDIEPLFAHVGKLPESDDPAAKAFVLQEAARLQKIADGLRAGKDQQAGKFEKLAQDVKACAEEMNV